MYCSVKCVRLQWYCQKHAPFVWPYTRSGVLYCVGFLVHKTHFCIFWQHWMTYEYVDGWYINARKVMHKQFQLLNKLFRIQTENTRFQAHFVVSQHCTSIAERKQSVFANMFLHFCSRHQDNELILRHNHNFGGFWKSLRESKFQSPLDDKKHAFSDFLEISDFACFAIFNDFWKRISKKVLSKTVSEILRFFKFRKCFHTRWTK